MSDFSVEWLALRESADARSRDARLLHNALSFLQNQKSLISALTIADLGAGTGSTMRMFSSLNNKFAEELWWRLIDRAAPLLAEAKRRHKDLKQVQYFKLDLNELVKLPLNNTQLITASALFDLVSAEFIDAFADMMKTLSKKSSVGFYSSLNYDGAITWEPSHPLDETVLYAFNEDQRRDKGFGLALGPDANAYLREKLENSGFEVSGAPSPWQLDNADENLVLELISGIANALTSSSKFDRAALAEWVAYRKAHVKSGSCSVGHQDILALPENIHAI